jgi:tetratricopeptide (TPR) repeat protein
LDVLPRAQSTELLRRFSPDAEDMILDAIAAEVGDLPLALHLAGSYLHRYRRAIAPKQYLTQLRDPRLLQHPSMQGAGFSPTGHIEHVGRTFALSYERLQREDSRDALARRLLIHMACFAPGEPVWYDVLVRTLALDPEEPNDAVRAEDAFARLIELGLIQVEGEKGMRIHRLVATFVRETVPEEATRGQRTIEEMIYANLKRTNYEGAPLALLPGEVHMAHVIEETAQHDAAWGATLSAELGWHLWLNGDYTGARTYFENALEIRRRVLGEEDVETARSYNNLGALLCDLDDFQNSQAMLEKALALRLRLLGEAHVDTAETLNNLGILHLTQQHNGPASDYLQRALTLYEAILGAEHLTVAEVANNLGVCFLRGLGDPRHAQPHLEHALAVRRQQLGEMHPYTALVYHNLGVVLFELGKYEQARSNFEQAAAIRRQALGEAHQDTALSHCLLGAVQVYTGAVDAGMAQLEAAIETCRERVGEHHLITAFCTTQWGRCLHKLGEFGKAQNALSQALKIRQSIYQDENPAIGETLDYLGRVYLDQEDLEAAADCFQQAFAIHQRTLGAEHPQSAATRFHIGLLLAAKGEVAQAIEWILPAASIFEEKLGAEHPRTQEAILSIRYLAL